MHIYTYVCRMDNLRFEYLVEKPAASHDGFSPMASFVFTTCEHTQDYINPAQLSKPNPQRDWGPCCIASDI